MELHILKILFVSMTLVMVVIGGLLNSFEKYLPTFLSQSFRFGKFAYKGKQSKIKVFEVPKRWFSHFYVFAAVYSLLLLGITLKVYFMGETTPTMLKELLNTLATSQRSYSVSPAATLIALFLMTSQCIRRFYETWFVSVFSDAKMNLAHYIVGYAHYFGAISAILAEAPGFSPLTGVNNSVHKLNSIFELRWFQFFGILCFSLAFHLQWRTAVILADLRKDHSGKVNSYEYKIPRGGLFSFVSSPHNFAEVLIYASLMLILWGNSIFPYIFVWVLSNQVETALLTHWWYQEKVKEYPKRRKAIIPFIL